MSDYRQTGRTTRQIEDLVDCAMGEPGRTVVWVDSGANLRHSSYGKILHECGERKRIYRSVIHDMRIELTNGSAIQCIAIEQGLMFQALEGVYHRVFVAHDAWIGLDQETREWIVWRHKVRIGEKT